MLLNLRICSIKQNLIAFNHHQINPIKIKLESKIVMGILQILSNSKKIKILSQVMVIIIIIILRVFSEIVEYYVKGAKLI